ncbi:D-alanine--poly(phosphoribitol) ligase [Butyrivibrio sp. CB08]|uniref:amino acid adenylation domain-containing protein n=1 Tax=Butyrivibrio sp. CB08 TaxID=2364879 RepID=UPI000EAABB05|nr:amino acid adenylation domain-containing protein [Butyrivibrio sp. CB08]RKM59274.1 D-alanine--poly(phosphoribitol) ligase [Butyrivibrio sp. CB08]
MSYCNSVLDLIEGQAILNKDKVAFTDPGKEITFGELYLFSRKIGTFLADKIVRRSPVSFYMEKSCDALVGMFGAVYAGGFYSFLDVRQPAARAESILNTLKPRVVFTDASMFDKAKELSLPEGTELILLDDLIGKMGDLPVDEDKLGAIRDLSQDIDPLYVNFTSGSTGVPKGVTVCHRSVLEFIGYFVDIFGIEEGDVLGNQAPFDFDVSVKDVYSGLMSGARIALIPREYFSNPMTLMDYLADQKVTVIVWAVSAMCFVSIMNGLEYRCPEDIRMIMFSGEVMPVKHLNHWKKFFSDATYVNLYGPTEITCNCTYHVLDRDYEENEVIPAGIPFPNESVFLLDDEDKLVTDPGKEGEICVTGTSLALGYYGDKDKTDAAFMQNPLNNLFQEMMYRTGDIGRYDEKGILYYVSRKDFQIKHMGHRIELGEIEVGAMAVEGVTRACCIYEQDKKKLILFYTGDKDKKELLSGLKEDLPPYMVPSTVKQLDEMPINKNGKIDRTYLLKEWKNL